MTNQTAQLLSFPVQMQADDTPVSSLNEPDAVQEARIQAMIMLNRLATGELAELSEESKESIRTINAFCLRWGYPPIDCDL